MKDVKKELSKLQGSDLERSELLVLRISEYCEDKFAFDKKKQYECFKLMAMLYFEELLSKKTS